MDGWDLDDYERRQAELEFVGPDEDWIEQQLGDRDEVVGSLADAGLGGSVGRLIPHRQTVVTLKHPKRCASCHEPIAVGEEAVAEHTERGWLMWHPGHETRPAQPTDATEDIEPDERRFELRFTQPCGRCGAPMAVGQTVAGRKLDHGWAVRHLTCPSSSGGRPQGSGGT